MARRVRSEIAAAVLGGLLTLGLLPACKQEVASSPAPPIPQVGIIVATAKDVPDEPEFIGQAESSRPVEIRSQVTGIIKEWFFKEGRDVKKGERLYQIDRVPFEAAMLSAKAKVSQSEARLVQAKQNLARVKPLLAEQAVSTKDVDDAIAEELAAKAALEGAKAELVKAKFDLDNTLIVAPINGMIERTRVYEGRLVSAQTDLLTVIHQVDPMYVIVSAPESFLLKRRRDSDANRIKHPGVYHLRGVLTFVDGTTYDHEGVLDLLDVGLKTETGSRQARVVFPNPDRALLPGQFVRVRFKGTLKTGAIVVPQRAVQQGPKGSIVFVVGVEDKVEIREIQATSWQGTEWIVEEGLHAGDRVIVDGLHKIAPGAPVKVVPIKEPAAASAPASAATQSEQAQ
ncbi:efflux RND transporter periplasmic adaptor subunit [Nitrospirales bacterium NOB]|nr:MAG: RND efflux system, membrane fusion protein [Nitrospira sp. OLB3]MBV6470635.1 Toluene efflux pump periplasmic linker protein TtgA [Nitrospirota bacterium]MCE7965452.1 efflux RND transporter periplasmic adaptor subunit [Nitrospira sp. NTP2]MCK6498478.1 efflux RND transporter periplasmic adaptor subunit [Nitrospira sp.]MDL1888113.1 efflux RND transporter periplasmic adaptor subunit [Nitrospirales bacterium NOB]MEB2338426.1 efflux RND transporter periplasmic adaptor subunit [Nitrospirales 